MGNHPVSAVQHLLGDRGVEPLVRIEEGHAELHEEEGDAQRQQDGHEHRGPQEQDERASSPGNERRSPHHYLSGQAGGVAHRALRKRSRGLCFGAQSEGSPEAGRGGGGSQGRPRASLGSLYRRQSIATPSPMTSARSPNAPLGLHLEAKGSSASARPSISFALAIISCSTGSMRRS